MRSTRSACATEAAKQQLEVVDFVTFNRLDDNNWDTTIRARRKGRLVRVGCRYDLRAGWTHIYEPAAADGGNPWGPGGPPTAGGAAAALPAAKDAAREPPRAAPRTASPAPSSSPAVAAAKPPAKPAPGAGINLASVADTSARTAISRTREACLAEASRRKIAVDDFEAFRRVEGTVWEAMLVVNKARTARSCRLDLSAGKATIK